MKKILILEDEENIRSFVVINLERSGYFVLEAENGQQALTLLRENPDPTDDEIRAFLAGNLCRCSGYDGQLRGIRNYLNSRKA